MATRSTRATAAKKADAAPAPAPAEDVDATTAPDPEPADDKPADDETPEETGPSDAPRQAPAAAALDAPEPRKLDADAPGVKPSSIITDSSGQLSVDMLTQKPAEIRSELYDSATKKAPNPDDVFDLEFPNGQAVICQIRLCENLWITGQNEPMSRLVMAKGQRTDRAYAEQIIAVLKQQIGETPADDAA